MSGLLESCSELYGTRDLYCVLNISKDADEEKVKRGYRKLSLLVHPDRVEESEKELATKKFQTLGKVYSILSDKEKRTVYDETGEVDDVNDIPQDRDWYEYWRILFKTVTVEDLNNFETKYKGSAKELEDLKEAYVKHEGNMDAIFGEIMCSNVYDDEKRFRQILTKLIIEKEVPDFASFTRETEKKRKRRREKAKEEAKEAEEARLNLRPGTPDDGSLQALIQKNQSSRQQNSDDFFSKLEDKYASKERKLSSAKKTNKKKPKK